MFRQISIRVMSNCAQATHDGEIFKNVARSVASAFVITILLVHSAIGGGSALRTGDNWPTVDGDDFDTRYSPLAQINTNNVKDLRGAWFRVFDTRSRSSPVVVDGVMYFNNGTTIYALNAETGKTLWRYTPADSTPSWGGIAVAAGKVYFGLVNTQVTALDAKTGKPVWISYIGNAPPVHSSGAPFGPYVPNFDAEVGLLTGAPTYINGNVVIGVSGGDAGARCKIVALNATDGKLAWQWWVVPSPGDAGSNTWPSNIDYVKFGGGGVWSRGAADPKLGLVYYGTGNPAPSMGGEVRPGDNLYTASVVALDAKSGKLKWYYQLSHHDLWENDVSTPVILFDAKFDGRVRKALAVMRTDGYLFLLDRATGRPIVPIEERAVRQDHRLRTSPTQPFPVGTEQVGPNCVQPDEMILGFVSGCFFDPLYYDDVNFLNLLSNIREAPMSFDPQTGDIYVPAGVSPWWYRRAPDPYIILASQPPGTRGYGIVAAISNRTHRIVWQKRSPWPLTASGGLMTTGGGLMFRMEGDGNFLAFDAKTGRQVWKFQTGDLGGPTANTLTSSAPSAAYQAGGEEYIAVPVGRVLWAFSLHGTIAERAPPPVPPTTPGFQGMVQLLGPHDEIAIALLQPTVLPGPNHYVDEASLTPRRAEVEVNQRVTFMNYGLKTHTIVSSEGDWSAGPIAPGQAASVIISRPGRYTYYATEYPWSKGQLIVQGHGSGGAPKVN